MKKINFKISKFFKLNSYLVRITRIIRRSKRTLTNFVRSIVVFHQIYWNKFFNDIVKEQNENPKSIPIIIISFNQLYYLKKLICFLSEHNYTNIIIIDNNSTYEPLLNYFDVMEDEIKIHRLERNLGHAVLWKDAELFNLYTKGYFAVTDPDVVPNSDCPGDFLLHFKSILDSNCRVTKAGFSLRLDDIPDTNANKKIVLKWESRFWTRKMKGGNYKAIIDTTFALYRPHFKYDRPALEPACRTKKPYEAMHGGWYVDNNNLTDEQKYFFDHCNGSSSWRIDGEGDLKNKYYSS